MKIQKEELEKEIFNIKNRMESVIRMFFKETKSVLEKMDKEEREEFLSVNKEKLDLITELNQDRHKSEKIKEYLNFNAEESIEGFLEGKIPNKATKVTSILDTAFMLAIGSNVVLEGNLKDLITYRGEEEGLKTNNGINIVHYSDIETHEHTGYGVTNMNDIGKYLPAAKYAFEDAKNVVTSIVTGKGLIAVYDEKQHLELLDKEEEKYQIETIEALHEYTEEKVVEKIKKSEKSSKKNPTNS
jgi:hypothetical protein